MARRQAWLREMGLGSFVPAWVGVPIAIFFPPAQAKSRANVLCATADRDDDDLEGIMLYAQFRKARHWAKGRR